MKHQDPLRPAAMPERTAEPIIASEPEPNEASDQVREPPTSSFPVGVLMEYEDSAYTESEPHLVSVLIDEEVEDDIPCGHLSPLVPPSSMSPVVPPSSPRLHLGLSSSWLYRDVK